MFNDTVSTVKVMWIRVNVAMVVFGEAVVDYVKASSLHSRGGTEENLLQ